MNGWVYRQYIRAITETDRFTIPQNTQALFSLLERNFWCNRKKTSLWNNIFIFIRTNDFNMKPRTFSGTELVAQVPLKKQHDSTACCCASYKKHSTFVLIGNNYFLWWTLAISTDLFLANTIAIRALVPVPHGKSGRVHLRLGIDDC